VEPHVERAGADDEDPNVSPARARVAAPIALAALSVGAALSLRRVFADDAFALAVVGAAVLPFVVGAIARVRAWPVTVAFAISGLALVVYVVVALESSTLHSGLPLGDTWDAVATQLEHGWRTLRTAPAPAPTTNGAVLLAVIVTWVVSAIADWLAFTRHAVLGALAPALVVFVWSSTLGTKDDWAVSAAVFAVLAGCFLVAQNLALVEQRRSWLVTRSTARSRWVLPTVLVSAVAVIGALAIAPVIEDPAASPLVDLNAPGNAGAGNRSYNAGVPPLLDVGAKLRDTGNPKVFTVTSPVADYWRITALDEFSSDGGGQWTLEAAGDGKVTVGLPDRGAAGAGAVRQHFVIADMAERWLPAAYRPVAISLPDTLVVVSSWTLVTGEDSVQGLDYTVDSVLGPVGTQVTPVQQAATDATVPPDLRQYTALPTDFPKEIGVLAENVVRAAGATTPYAKAAALRDWFRSPVFSYDKTVDYGDDTNAILTFLRAKRGFCVQFASAYAVMARALGIPTRIAVGYTSGTRSGNTFTVTAHDSHAWPEVWLAGLGWTHLFDPTPAATAAQIGGSALANEPPVQPSPAVSRVDITVPPATTTPPATGGAGTATSVGPATAPTGASGTGAPTGSASPGSAASPGSPPLAPTVSTASGSDNSVWQLIAAVVGAIALLVAAYVGTVLGLKRRRRARRREGEPGVAVQGAWDEALDRLREFGVPGDPALTPLELARSTPARTTLEAAQPLRRLARTYTTARYGAVAVVEDDARRAWESVDALEQALDGTSTRGARWRRRLDPTTLRT
jgi:transglutaminase-like putative cysteine protease